MDRDTMDIKTRLVSCEADDKIQSVLHESILDLQDEGFTVIGVNILPFHLYESKEHRVVITYLRKNVSELIPQSFQKGEDKGEVSEKDI